MALALVDALRDSRASAPSLRTTTPARRFDQLDRCKRGEPDLAWDPGGLRGCRERIVVASEAVVQQGGRPVRCGDAQPLAPGKEVIGARPDQPRHLVLTSTVGSQRQRAVARSDAIARGPGERICLLDERRRCLRLACQEVDADARGERERQFREQPCLPRSSDVVSRQQVPSLVFPDESSCPTGQPPPTQRLGSVRCRGARRLERVPQPRRSGRRPVGDQRREPVEEQVHGAWS